MRQQKLANMIGHLTLIRLNCICVAVVLMTMLATAEESSTIDSIPTISPVTELLFKRQAETLLSLFVDDSAKLKDITLYYREGYTLAFIYWANSHSSRPAFLPSKLIESYIVLLKPYIRKSQQSHLSDPLAIADIKVIGPENVSMIWRKGVPDAVVLNSDSYRQNVVAFRRWLEDLTR